MRRVERTRGRLVYALIGLCVFGLMLVAPIRIPFSMEVRGVAVPATRWTLTKGTDGQLIGSRFNYATGLSAGYSVSQFARGEAVRVDLHPAVAESGRVGVGDTVATILSTEAEERLAELRGEVAIAQAALVSGSAGQKESLIQAAEHQLELATAAAAQQHRELDRVSSLFDDKLIAAQEFEAAQTAARLADVEVSIAQAELDVARSGDKPEEIQLHRSGIDALSQQISALEKRLESFTITSPIDGMVSRGHSPDTLLVVSDASTLVLLMPIDWASYEYAFDAAQVTVDFQGSRQTATAKMISFQPEIRLFNGEPAVVATALLEKVPEGLLPGMVTRCVIHGEPITILERLRRLVQSSWV